MSPTTSPERMKWDAPEIAALIRSALEEDVGAGDVTTSALVPSAKNVKARIIAKQELVVAGLPLAQRVFRAVDKEIRFISRAQEGSRVSARSSVAQIAGTARAILGAERVALNFLAHLSGIATLTRQFVEAIAGTGARIRDTRKTIPLLRALEKYAVRIGGGANHRFGLFDAILIKENHIAAAGSVAEALRRARDFAALHNPTSAEMTAYESYRPPTRQNTLAIQVEVRNEGELRQALGAGADAVLLDNVSPAEAARLVEIARRERPVCAVEVSGGVTLVTVRAYAEARVDFISVGALTHSAPAADFSLLVEPPQPE